MTLTLVEIGENNINNINGNDSEEMEGNGGLYCNGSIGNGHILVDDSKPGKTTVISSTDPHEHLLDRVKQTGAMLFYLFTFLLAPGYIAAAFLAMAFCPFFWPFLLLYLAWFIYDFKAPCRGSRSNDAIHNWSLWRNVANYYPIEVHKTADIPPDRNYVFASHPHGVFATGTFILLGCGAHNFRKLFPGIKMHIVTLPMNFWFPLRREFYLLFGNMISSHVEALEYVLDSEGKGNAIGIVPGGAAEALHAFPGMNRLVLAKRKGFVRLAIKYGAYLVPVYNFGENDVLEQLPNPEGSFIRKLQECGKQLMGFSLPLCYGQNTVASVLPKSWLEKLPRFLTIGLLPFRRKIVTVVGEPLPVPKDPNPSRELVNRVHAEYCAKLEELFNKYKSSLGGLPDSAKLEFV